MGSIRGNRVLVTGGHGFLGRHVCRELATYDPAIILAPRRAEYDLREMLDVRRLIHDVAPDIVIHLAAVVGGIAANRASPGQFFYENAIMGLQLIEEARRARVAKFVVVGTVCSYPKFTPIPFQEKSLWDGYPEETNAPYGLAKRMLLAQARAYREQYDLNAIALIPVNLYGPGDNFELESGHVVPSLIRKAIEAKEQGSSTLAVWGTGTASREFLFVRDAAEAIVLAADRYDDSPPLNIGTGEEIRIAQLAELVCELCRFEGKLVFDPSRPDGQPRRRLDVSAAESVLGFRARTRLRDGISETISWYERTRGRDR